ncbi:cytochrome c1 [Chitinimonas taiwanensis]|uniref:Ubiquinol-cytochrome c reductase cytochrome c1 subunit n=1 Tax=Chitinimonas taiwanensis DSM 18899 TaxID=1121279 RepID=A0A1K2HK88_9NEIS|nr:cytochrome c1 [Chitinimonas taiwanensis]SFZ77085.1 ubiquinol-cytochrome c reductase cytochrome c1 subunit [Chitinimonas taiwanensis DSM 18899]
MKNKIVKILAACSLLLPLATPALAAGASVALDHSPSNVRDVESLQRGAQLFANYCLSCHGASAMRYNRLQDLGLSEEQIRTNLMFASEKVGEPMRVAMQAKDGKVWFGATPPDLSLIARSRGADWLYTYLRSFYRDPSRPTGWNNTVFDKVGMPHVLWQLQGDLELKVLDGKVEAKGPVVRSWETVEHVNGKEKVSTHQLVLTRAGELTRLTDGKANTFDYDNKVADLTNYIVWMGEPAQVTRERIGYGVLLFLIFLLVPMAYLLKKEYWRDIH